MKQVFRGVGFGVVAALTCASAGAYQIEAGGMYVDYDGDDSELGVYGAYHLAPVDTSGVPLGEAGFLRRSSNVFAGYSTTDESEVDTIGLGFEGYFDNFYASFEIADVDAGGDGINPYTVMGGYMPQDGVLFALSYSDADDDLTTAIGVHGKFVQALAGDTAYNLEVDIAQVDFDFAGADDVIAYSVLGDYFLNSALSIGLRYADSDADGSEATIGLGAEMFFIPTLAGFVEYADNDAAGSMMTLGVRARF